MFSITLLVTILVAGLRFTVPGHSLTGWPGTYEALAHIWVGGLITLIAQRIFGFICMLPWRALPLRCAWNLLVGAARYRPTILLFVLIALEIVKFLTR